MVAAWGDNTYGQTRLPGGVNNVKAIAGGEYHSLALRSDGALAAWGSDSQRQSTVPSDLTNVKAIAAGSFFSLALKADGTVVAWGYNYDGQTNLPVNLSRITAIACGAQHLLALNVSGTVTAWGQNFRGQTNVPAGLSEVIAIAAGGGHSLALRADGSVVAWGYNLYGQTNVPAGLSNVTAIAAGGSFSLALKADGQMVGWGNNAYGQTSVAASLSNVTAIAANNDFAMALKADGTVVTWGRNPYGEFPVPPGLSNVTAIAAGAFHSLALVPEGPVQIVQNPQSQGITYTSNVTFSVVAAGREPFGYQWLFNGSPINPNARVSGTTNATLNISNAQFADIGAYSVVISNAFGSVISAGASLAVISPPFITQQPVGSTVRAGSSVLIQAVAWGTPPLLYQWNFNSTAIPGATNTYLSLPNAQPSDSGSYYMRVTNAYGSTQTISATLTVTDSPPFILQQPSVPLPGQGTTTNAVVPIGGGVTVNFTARGSLPLNYQWRFNGMDIPGATNTTLTLTNLQYNQAGYYNVEVNNDLGSTNSAKFLLNVAQVLITGTPFANNINTPLGLSNVIAVAAGGSHVMALRSDGTVRTWLANAGFIFEQAFSVTNVPASVTNVMAIAAGLNHCLALRANGTVVAWGAFSSATNVPPGLSNVIAIAAGSSRSYAVRSDGTITGWGSSATVPTGLSNVVGVAAGPSQNLALRRDGTVAMWSASSSTFSVVSGLSNAIAVATSPTGNRALRQDGTVVTWPLFSTGQPVLVNEGRVAVSNVVAIALGGTSASMILKQDGTLVASELGKISLLPATNNINAIAAGGVQSGFGVIVVGNGSPTITLQPYSQVVQRSNTVQLHSRAVGVQPMRYQWLLDNLPLPGATNASLILANVLGKDTGAYRMIASNALGTAASQIATITIPFNTNLPAALNTTNWNWLTPSDRSVAWFVQNRETHDGDAAAQSGTLTNGGQSTLQGSYTTGPGTLTFWWKVSSEEGFDFLRVFLDQSTTPLMSISGETGWEQRTITFTNGTHLLRWVYTKDMSVSVGRDAGWLDQVAFTPVPPTAYIQPASQTVSGGKNASFFAVTLSEAKPVTYQWMRFGTNIAGATNQTMLLSGVGRKDRGSYSVRVGNAGGNVTTSNATLRVNIQQRFGSLQRGADGSMAILSRDADDGALSALDLPMFEAQVSTNLVHWQVLPESLSVTNGSLLLRDPAALLWPQRFYRIVEH